MLNHLCVELKNKVKFGKSSLNKIKMHRLISSSSENLKTYIPFENIKSDSKL